MCGRAATAAAEIARYELNVDLGLRWSEEGDNLNRLGNGQFSHIALAIGDFRTLTMTVVSPGSVQLAANVLTGSPTQLPTTMPTTGTPTLAPTQLPTGFITPPAQPTDTPEDTTFIITPPQQPTDAGDFSSDPSRP